MRGDRSKRKAAKYQKKESARVKRLRRSSFNALQRNIEVFNDNKEFLNKYENLELDLSDPENRTHLLSEYNDDLTQSDGESKADNHNDSYDTIPVIDIDSGDEGIVSDIKLSGGKLEDNDDFIAFSSSSEDENSGAENNESEDYLSSGNTSSDDELAGRRNAERELNADFPWLLNHDHSKQKEISDWLTAEIRDFVAYISPSREEIETRNKTIAKIRRSVKRLWTDADLQVFGSYATDMYLPGSDIDCVVNSKSGDKENRQYLYELARHLKNDGLATRVEVIAKSRVPIIKFVEPESDIHIDVSFERSNGLEAAKLIREWIGDTPGLRELTLVVKQFLHARRLNDVHTGGLGGFSIICLVFSFLRLHPRIITGDIDPLDNLGVLLIEFFELYGKNFAYDDVAICVDDSRATYKPKTSCRFYPPARTSFTLAIQDPGDPTNNLSRGSFNVRDIKKSFSGAFDLLVNKCFELDAATFKNRVGKSILGNVIKYRGAPRDFNDERALVENRAIIENEHYHRKRARVVHADDEDTSDEDDMFINISANEEETEEMYKVEKVEKVVKKRKIAKADTNTKTKTKTNAKAKARNHTSIDQLMGIPEDEEPPVIQEREKKSLSMQDKRDYWLSKGQAL